MKNKAQIDMTKGHPLKLLLAFTLPALLSNFLSQVYSLTDSIIVGKVLGNQALDAIGVTMPIILLIVSLVIGVNIGCGVLMAQSFGKKEYGQVRHIFANSFYFALFLSTIIALSGFFLSKQILIWMQTPENILAEATKYLQVSFVTMLFPLSYYLLYNAFRSIGDSLSALWCLLVSAISNIGLDFLFVLVFKMGVEGTAIATAIAQGLSVIFALVLLYIKYPQMRIHKEDAKLNIRLMGDISRLAIPFALQAGINNLGNVLVQGCVNQFGENVISSYTVGSRIAAFALIPVENVGSSLSVYTSQNVGAGTTDRIEPGVKASHILNLGFSAVIGLVLGFAGIYMIPWFLKEPAEEVVHEAYRYLLIAGVPCILCGIMNIYQYVLKGMGKAADSLIAGFMQLAAKAGIAFAAAYAWHNVLILWFAWPISFVAGTLYPLIRYFWIRKKWKKEVSVLSSEADRAS